MKTISKIIGAAVAAMLVVGLTGCITVTTTAPSNSSNSAASSSASDNADNNNASSAASNTGKNANASNASNSNANSANSNTGDWGRGDAEPVDGQRLGSAKVGYVTVPSDWKDFTDKLDSRMVDSSGAVYLVDPTTEFTSGVESHFAYSSSIKLETFPCKYTEKADEILYKYRGETDNYADVNIEKTTFAGNTASIVTCNSADNVDIANIVIEKDANSCVMLTVWGTPSNYNAVMGYAKTWSMSK